MSSLLLSFTHLFPFFSCISVWLSALLIQGVRIFGDQLWEPDWLVKCVGEGGPNSRVHWMTAWYVKGEFTRLLRFCLTNVLPILFLVCQINHCLSDNLLNILTKNSLIIKGVCAPVSWRSFCFLSLFFLEVSERVVLCLKICYQVIVKYLNVIVGFPLWKNNF